MTDIEEHIVSIQTDSDSNEPDTHEALPLFLLPFRPIIILVILVLFIVMIGTTIIMNLKEQFDE